MEKVLLLFCLVSAASATFFQTTKQVSGNACNLCIYSANPGKYTPKCFLCLNTVYPTALKACINATIMPNNISYTQADCMEKNCAINYPKSQPSKIGSLVALLKRKFSKRSAEDLPVNSINFPATDAKEGTVKLVQKNMGGMDLQNLQITQQVDAFASDEGFDEDY